MARDTSKIAQKPKKTAVKKTTAVKTVEGKKTSIKMQSVAPKGGAITVKKAVLKKSTSAQQPAKSIRIIFQLHFHTVFGQELFITGNHPLLGDGSIEHAVPMQYFNEQYWYAVIEPGEEMLPMHGIEYNYVLRNTDGTFSYDWGTDKKILPLPSGKTELLCLDTWNFAGYFENTYYTEPFSKVLLRTDGKITERKHTAKTATHIFKIKSPLLAKHQTLCVLGSCGKLGAWNESAPVLTQKGTDGLYTLSLDLTGETFPIAYKYGIYDTKSKSFIAYENGNNRVLQDAGSAKRLTIMNDGFAVLPNNTWKGAGVAIPVFSLRTEKSFGVGEFTDIKLLVDWSKQVGLKMIQLLPVNDTTATHTWTDSYPYAAISAFALHPLYLTLSAITDDSTGKRLQKMEARRKHLNQLETVDYEAVTKLKMEFAAVAFAASGDAVLSSADYQSFFKQNRHWLVPYAAFCYLREQYGTVDFNQWPAYQTYNEQAIQELTAEGAAAYKDISLYYFIQYHLHVQLKDAAAYAHAHGIILKGDIAIGVYRHGVDAWQDPSLYHLDFQAGAPPDDFAVKGQNWGFPTYNWQTMREDGFAWWKQRFEQMSYYFDAFRIDHILGFFRIWSIPMDAVEGIMGHFVPAIPVHISEFHNKGIAFDHARYTRPFISEAVLWEVFGYDNELVKSMFLVKREDGNYDLKPAYGTQRLVEAHFATLEQDEHHARIQLGLYTLISNVILFEAEQGDGQHFHFRFGIESTSSFRSLDYALQQQLKELYVNYYFERQDDFWRREAVQKLPALKRVTNMLVCGEDLGLVPACVPEVMRQLGLLSLEIQRMPKDPKKEFFHPDDAPFLSVVTPSTHDMSTIRGWWEEDREKIQHFYNRELGQAGEAPRYCEAWINKAIVLQHLHSPAMWSVFQLQDLLGIDGKLRRDHPADERINIPADPKHYWRYRMHLSLEELLKENAFNDELRVCIAGSGRG